MAATTDIITHHTDYMTQIIKSRVKFWVGTTIAIWYSEFTLIKLTKKGK